MMKRFMMVASGLVAAFALVWCALSQNQIVRAGDDKPDGKTKTIPLKSIYSTSRQEGVKVMDRLQGDDGFENQLRELSQRASRMGASNVFLARGDDITAAAKATWEVFNGHPVKEPVSPDGRSKSEQFWLVAYLGVTGSDGPEGPAWRIKSVAVSGRDVRLTFANPGALTNDKHPYFYWVPLGKLGPGIYALELVDADEHVTLLRRVKVSAR